MKKGGNQTFYEKLILFPSLASLKTYVCPHANDAVM